MHEAIVHGHKTVVQLLENAGAVLSSEAKAQFESKMCALALNGDLDQMRMLVEAGVVVNAADHDRRSVLHIAASRGYIKMVQYLIEHGGDVNATDRWGATPITEALYQNHANIVDVLSKAGAFDSVTTLEAKGRMSRSPSSIDFSVLNSFMTDRKAIVSSLLDAAAAGDKDEVARLLECGADVNDADYDHRSSLHLACSEGHLAAVAYLIEASATVDVVDRWGHTPLHDAILAGHAEVADLLRRSGAELPAEGRAELEAQLRTLAAKGDAARAGRLLYCGVEPNATDADGRAALHLAASAGHLEAAELLVARGADVNLRDGDGDCPLDLAVASGHEHVTAALRLAGALSAPASSLGSLIIRRGSGAGRGGARMLLQAFPTGIAEAVLAGRAPAPVSRECVSVFFSDVVGFTTLSAGMEAGRVSRMLGRLFARMDALAAEHGVQKVDVIGDAYLAATNFTEEQVFLFAPPLDATSFKRFVLA